VDSSTKETKTSEFDMITIKGVNMLRIIHASVLIDKKSRIKMVTPPWVTEDMTKLFY